MELADLDGDGYVDILFANGGDYDAPGSRRRAGSSSTRATGTFEDATDAVMGDLTRHSRVIKVADLDGDRATTSSSARRTRPRASSC